MDKVLSVTLSIDSNEFDAMEHRDPSKVDPRCFPEPAGAPLPHARHCRLLRPLWDVLRTMQLIGDFGAMFLLVFLLGLRTYLRRRQDPPSLLTTGVVTAGMAVVSMSLIANAANLSVELNAGRVEANANLQLLHDFANATEVLMSLPLAAVVAFTSVILVRGQHGSRWIGLTGFPVAALLVFRALAVGGGPTLLFPPLYPVWFEALAISMAVRELRGGGTGVQSVDSIGGGF